MKPDPSSYQTCPNCGSKEQLAYCPDCGQKRRADFTLKSILRDAGEMIWGADSRLANTLRDYVNPGVYTRNWLDKKQARYISPVKMFLIINVVYFLFLSFLSRYELNFDTFVTSFETQIENQIYSGLIDETSLDIISSAGFENETFARLYNSRVFAVSNSFILVLSILIAGALYLVNLNRSRLIYHHVTMGLYYGGGILLLFIALNLFLVMLVPILQMLEAQIVSNALLDTGIVLACLVFTFTVQVRMYDENRMTSFLKSIIITLLIAFAGIILYRFVLFWITMASVLIFS